MGNLQSTVTTEGQISVPDEVRRQLGVGPGSVLIWERRDDGFIVRRAEKSSSVDVDVALFDAATLGSDEKSDDTRTGILRHMRQRHARR